MGRDLRIEYENAFYHVISRGNTRSRIFKKVGDRQKFLEYLQAIHEKYWVRIHAYCLMGNHYHLLLETPQGNLGKVMHTLNTSYTNHYNHRHSRSGHLFSGRYKAILVEKESYAMVLSSYIHLNPVKAGLAVSPEKYEWSSYGYYSGRLYEIPNYMETGFILGLFGTDRDQAQKSYVEYVKAQENKGKDPFANVTANAVLGRRKYLDWLRENAERNGWIKGDARARRAL